MAATKLERRPSDSLSEDESSRKKSRISTCDIGIPPSVTPAKTVTLESLPSAILDLIFQYVQTPDLLKLCPLSRNLHWPAVCRIYHSITITSDYYIPWIYDRLKHWKLNRGTMLSTEGIAKFIHTLKENPALRDLVRTLIANAGPYTDTEAVGISVYLRNLTVARGELLDLGFSPESHTKIKSYTGAPGQSISTMRNLVELKIVDEPGKDECDYETLATDILKLGAHNTLRALHFVDPDEPFFPSSPSLLGCLLGYLENPHNFILTKWEDFLPVFEDAGVKLELTSLGLTGHNCESTESYSAMIQNSIKLEGLKTLVLRHSENENEVPTLLELLTKHTPLLTSLKVIFTQEYKRRKAAIIDTLTKNIPDQLTDLYIMLHVPRPYAQKTRNDFQKAVARSQRNLQYFTYEDGHALHPTHFLLDVCQNIIHHTGVARIGDSRESNYVETQDIYHSRPLLSEEHVAYITQNIGPIRDLMKRNYLFSKQTSVLRSLKQFSLGREHFNMEEFGVFANDRTIRFPSESDVPIDETWMSSYDDAAYRRYEQREAHMRRPHKSIEYSFPGL